MGFFTWTDARIEKPKRIRYGNYKASQLIGYGGYAKVVCPDGTEIEESCYDGYGMFGEYDIYELVVDWNKDYLEEIFSKMEEGHFGIWLKPVAIALQNGGEAVAKEEAKRIIAQYPFAAASEWKRTIGIAIGCISDKKEILCPYPIKITTSKKHYTYDELYPSIFTQ